MTTTPTNTTDATSATNDVALARHAIENLIAEYAHGADLRDRDRFAAVWHDDARWDLDGTELTGIEAILAGLGGFWDAFAQMFHVFGSISIAIDGDTATGESTVHAVLVDNDGQAKHAVGRYVDTYTRVDGRWGIATRTTSIGRLADLA